MVVGLSYRDACERLDEAGYRVAAALPAGALNERDTTLSLGSVSAQNPAPGTLAERGVTIKLTVQTNSF
jgi:beta-lactam-binding protein with PASTA domain